MYEGFPNCGGLRRRGEAMAETHLESRRKKRKSYEKKLTSSILGCALAMF